MTNVQYLLMKLAEEASELSQIAIKTAQFGLEEKFTNEDNTNQQRIFHEFVDVLGVMEMLLDETKMSVNDFNDIVTQQNINKKTEKVQKWRAYSQKLGLTD